MIDGSETIELQPLIANSQNVQTNNYYHYYTRNNISLLLTISDCEYLESRRFINTISDHTFQNLCAAVFETIWVPNRYNIQNIVAMDFLFGQNETQEFINVVSTETTFFALLPFDLVCLASVGIYPFHDLNARIEIELGFGSVREFHQNENPHDHQRQL